ncbi:acyltransferase family protein [Mesorhizobium xinjiangense]|uniref:acyltransferase family protein n=1 Tax=Mesorhizobium xinjiangense TaxID=2678685 RepID=UPI0012ED71AA|nr:acyltransferase family protein [Mesorhizobium xinjiangense]
MHPHGNMAAPGRARIDWVDIGKGICIILVVTVHATIGVELAAGREGWMHYVVAFARPFRMPDFFLISGLFLGLVIDRPWRRYLDRKVVHFAYFYVLWLTIQFAFKAPGMAMEGGWQAPVRIYLTAFVQPFGTLWFIYLLPIFFVVTRLVRGLPAWLVLAAAAALEFLPVHMQIVIVDEFCSRYVYFFAGYVLAERVFAFADVVRVNRALALCAILPWAAVNAWLVFTPAPEMLAPFLQTPLGNSGATGGWSELPIVSLAAGAAGVLFVVAVSALLSTVSWSGWLRWLGAHSIVVYLAFFLPMAAARVVLLKTGLIADIGTVAFLATAAGVIGPVVLYGLVQWTGRGQFLFERPGWARVEPRQVRPREAVAPAE